MQSDDMASISERFSAFCKKEITTSKANTSSSKRESQERNKSHQSMSTEYSSTSSRHVCVPRRDRNGLSLKSGCLPMYSKKKHPQRLLNTLYIGMVWRHIKGVFRHLTLSIVADSQRRVGDIHRRSLAWWKLDTLPLHILSSPDPSRYWYFHGNPHNMRKDRLTTELTS